MFRSYLKVMPASAALRIMIVILLCANTFAQASEEAPPTPVEPKPSHWQWSFTLRNRTGLRLEEPHVLQMSRNFAEAKGIFKIDDNWRLTLEARAHYDPVERLGYPTSVWVDPRQVLLDGSAGAVNLKLGLQQVVWGQADGLRVLDVINPLDYREFILEDFLDSRRPLWMARADVPIREGSLQLLWIPYFAPGRLPGPDAEFGAGPVFGLGLITGSTAPIELGVEPTGRPARRIGSSQFGARYSHSLGGWDLTANYFHGWEDTPTPYLESLEFRPGSPVPTAVIRPEHDRREVIGGTAANSFGPLVLRLEAGWNRNKSVAATTNPPQRGFERAGQFSGVAGLDYSAAPWLWISGQYFLQFTSAPQSTLIFPRYNHLASIYFRTNFMRETLRPELFILTGLDQKQYLIRPRLVRTFGDHFSIGIGADFLGGRQTTIFGYFDTKDRTVLELKWLW
ncbi:MAG: hypothetical protein IPM66_02410 [Acidobacteriota bacterium]|nr:MAG: hypothetical protein IPM66_02410 [Acidobacteriota bacterium]